MNKTLLSLLVVAYLAVGCASTEPSAPAVKNETAPSASVREPPPPPDASRASPSPQPFEHESDREYQNGLTAMMSLAPVLGVKLVTAAFQVGYLAGLKEGGAYQLYVDGDIGSLGCMNGFAAVRDYFAPLDENSASDRAKVAHFQEICANTHPKAEVQGALFSEWRLKEAQWAGEHLSDPREVKGLITIYSVGYNMGFAHRWESVDQEEHLEKVVFDRCVLVVKNIQPSLSADHLAAATSRCAQDAQQERREFGPRFKCLLAGREMNGELSGEATKPGCTRQ